MLDEQSEFRRDSGWSLLSGQTKWKTTREKTPRSWLAEHKTAFVEVRELCWERRDQKETITNTDGISSRESKKPWGLRNGVFPSNHPENKT